MGANAQTTVPTFTAAQVLTADQMNQSARTGVPVFAGTVERDAGFGGTGEKVLAEGQLCYLESTNVVQYYDGATWATVGPSTPAALTYIGGTTIGSAVSSATVSNVFSSTYDNYMVTINSFTNSVTGSGFNLLRLDAGGTTDYDSWGFYAASSNADSTTNAAAARFAVKATGRQAAVCFLFGPNMAQNTLGWVAGPNGQFPGNYNFFIETSTQYTDFTVLPDSGTITGGQIRVYGIANS